MRIAQYIQAAVEGKEGNYMVFFPSYKMMQDVYEVFHRLVEGEAAIDGRYGRDGKKRILEICMQTSNMQEQEREQFLHKFFTAVHNKHSHRACGRNAYCGYCSHKF